jgi:shikimate kinase
MPTWTRAEAVSLAEPPLFLVGFMGCGKTAVGGALARRLGWELEETDILASDRAGLSIAEIFRRHGEERFRELEAEALRSLGRRTACVVATGGGLYVDWRHRRWIRERGLSVWLDVPLATALSRVGQDAGRPLWASEDPLEFRALFERRRAAYALADLRIPAGSGGPEQLAAQIVGRVFR